MQELGLNAQIVPTPPALSLEAAKIQRIDSAGSRQVFGLAGWINRLLATASQPVRPVRLRGFRSCSPLRGSPGFSPGSLLTSYWKTDCRINIRCMARGCQQVIVVRWSSQSF